ncbi:MAG: nuclear transport factor 2 family protein [Terracidiphilus sp.]|jgi:ketosteroid isomerase-like protein|nr:nuclear transport factor 2 family protein [Terracidiphilus sp.]
MTNSSKPLRLLRASGPALALAFLVAACSASLALQGGVPKAETPKAGMPKAQQHESRHEIDQLEEQWREALLKSNATAMQNLLADDYLAITSSGTLQTKDQTLENLRTGRTHFTQLEISDRKVRFYGSTALVTSIAEVRGATSEGEVSGSYRYTRVYVRDAQRVWKVVSFEVSRIREPGEHNEHK